MANRNWSALEKQGFLRIVQSAAVPANLDDVSNLIDGDVPGGTLAWKVGRLEVIYRKAPGGGTYEIVFNGVVASRTGPWQIHTIVDSIPDPLYESGKIIEGSFEWENPLIPREELG